MNKDQIKGKMDEAVGRARREAGESVGEGLYEVEGLAQEAKGKLEEAWGNAKEAVRKANKEAAVHHESRIEVELECAAEEDKKDQSK